MKRVLDVVVAATGLVILSPALLAIAVLIKADSPGPVFFRQVRVGRYGRPFRIFKFRTMTHVVQPNGPQLTVAGDARITRVGAVLRRYKLDELPQLLDVLRGTMSLVGPRPEVPRYVDHYPEDHRERVLSVRPGITDLASLHYRDENDLLARADDPEREYLEVILPAKLQYALDYVDNATVGHDLRVLGLTLRTVFVPPLPSPWRLLPMNDSKLWAWLDQTMSAVSPRRSWLAMLVDALTILACWHVTYLFRLGFERWQPGRPWYDDFVSLGVVIVYLACLALTGARRGLWRFFGFDDFKRITAACLMAGLFSAVAVLMAQLVGVARAVLLLHPLFAVVALSLVRMAYRMVGEHARACVNGAAGQPHRAIVIGAGDVARRLIAGIHMHGGWTVLAVLDDDPAMQGRYIAGIPVWGKVDEVTKPHICTGATHVIVALPNSDASLRERAIELAKKTGLPVLATPAESELEVMPG
ncbi:MAG: sugar transferase [Rhizobacter sp.]|nr:sugar transferase [Rhizobacter sp.]